MERMRTEFAFKVVSNKYNREELEQLFEYILQEILGSSEAEMEDDPKGYWVREELITNSVYTEYK